MIKEIRLRYDRDGHSMAPICVIRSRHYSSQLVYLNDLFEIARLTYPTLEMNDCKVVHSGGQSYAGTFGLEFAPPIDCEGLMPGWVAINELEKTK